MIALFSSIGWQEMFLLFFVGLLLYGRNLPDAGRSLGRVVAQLKRSFQDFKSQLDRDGEIGDVKRAISKTAREVKNVAKVPRAVSNPGGALRDLTHEAMSAPVDDEVEVEVEVESAAGDDHIDGGPVAPTEADEATSTAVQGDDEPA